MNFTSFTVYRNSEETWNHSAVQQKLEDWNYEASRTNTLSNVIQTIYLILGLFGNSLVLIIYKFKMDPRKDDRYFIPTLAVIDLCGCAFSITLSLLDNVFPVMFPSPWLCKILHFGTCTFIVLSLLVLVVISIQRFQKICRPFGFQMNLSAKRISLLLAVVLAIAISVPILILYGHVSVYNSAKNITGTECGSNPNLSTMGDIYRAILIPFEVVAVLSMCIFYILVGRKLFHQFNMSRKLRDSHVESNWRQNEARNSSLDSNAITLTDDTRDMTTNHENSNTESNNQDIKMREITTTKAEPETNKPFKRSSSVETSSHYRARRYTLMFMVISMVAILCYIPPWVFVILETKDSTFWRNLSYAKAQAFLVIRRFYIVNHIANPFIYGFFDTKFRIEIKNLFTNICKKR